MRATTRWSRTITRSAAGSAPVTARITTRRDGSERGRRRRTCTCRNTPMSTTARSASGNRSQAMAEHGRYDFKNPVARWFDSRLPILSLAKVHALDFPTPRNLNYFWTFGGILAVMLVVQIITGVVLVMHFVPHVDFAFDSIEAIRRDVNYGNIIQKMHAVGASMFFLAVYIHIFRGLYYGSYKTPREVLWMIGVLILLVMMATAFMGYVLPWGQLSFWGAKVITNLFSAIPFFGEKITTWLWGGYTVDNP